MSTPQNDGPAVPAEKKKGFDKYVERFKRAIGKSSSSSQKRLSLSAVAKPTPTAGSSSAGASKQKAAVAAPVPAPAPGVDATGIPVDGEIGPAVDRVTKEVRVRVHRECHECKKDFGTEQVCSSCGHKRCRECTRFPPKKIDSDDAPINVVIEKAEKYRLQITKPARAERQDLVLRKPVQRVRRNCHCCGTLFYPPTKTCTECGHIRCTDCPRDPPKPRKYPYGYPNDAFGEKNAYYTCHECENVFPLEETKCPTCTHEKCTECARAPPRKVEPQPDPEVLRRVEEKLAALALSAKAAEP